MIKKNKLYTSITITLGIVGAIFLLVSILSAHSADISKEAYLTSKTVSSPNLLLSDSTNTTYVPFNIGIGDTAPVSDVIIASNLSGELLTGNLISPTQTGLVKLFSEINAFDLDNKVTLLIYKGEAIIIIGQNSPSSYAIFASTVSSILSSKGITTKAITNIEVTSSNLESLFQAPPSCADSDGGLNYAIKGTVTGGGVSFSQTDYCLLLIPNGQADTVSCEGTNSNCRLHEFYCQDGVRKGERIQCPNGCSNGACNNAPVQTCTDSDGGYDRFKYGEVLVTGGPSNLVPTGKDRCYVLNSGPVTSCNGSLCTLEEYSCKDYNGDGVKESYGSGVENAPCPHGCSNGACNSAPPTGRCRTVYNHLEMTMANPIPTIAQLKLPEDMNYTYNNYLYGNWTISVKSINTDQSIVLVSVTRTATQTTSMTTLNKGRSQTISSLTIILDSIDYSTGTPKAVLYVAPIDSFNGNYLKTENTETYCYNNNLYKKTCPSTVTENSNFVETLIQNCAYGCVNNSCSVEPLNYYCNDTDYNNQYKTGYVFGFNSKGEFKYYDSCNNNILTEYICQNGNYASIQHICEYTSYDEDEYGCENTRCIPSYCNNTLFLERGNRYTINGINGMVNLSVENYSSESNQINIGVETEEGWQYSLVSEGDIFITNAKPIYIKDIFVDSLGGNIAAVFCYEPKYREVETVNISCPLFTPPSPGWCANGTIIQGTTDVNGCISPPTCLPLQNQGCIDSDGGINYNRKGTITYMNSTYTDYCKIYSENSLSVNDAMLSEYFCDSTQGGTAQYEEHVCPNGCINGACIDKTSYDLGDYPLPFISSNKNLDAIFIVGKRAKVDDVIGITDIVASLQRYAGDTVFPAGIVKFDDEVSELDIENNNLILVGGMCANSVLADIYGSPSKCSGRDKKGVGKIEIIPNKNQNKYILSVHGFEAEDTTIATRVLANWENYREIFQDANSLCITGTVDNLIVQKC